jgi:hypothetical protein
LTTFDLPKYWCILRVQLIFGLNFVVLVEKFVSNNECPFDAATGTFWSTLENGNRGARSEQQE